MLWPVVGGGNYISQSFHYGHYGLDIAADPGSRVRAAAAGTVMFAGWKSNGGGYQVWIAHGSGLYTTYNHMSGVSVGAGQHVGRGQQVGRVGCTGNCTGPHMHFEVWRGAIWNGGVRVNPLKYLDHRSGPMRNPRLGLGCRVGHCGAQLTHRRRLRLRCARFRSSADLGSRGSFVRLPPSRPPQAGRTVLCGVGHFARARLLAVAA